MSESLLVAIPLSRCDDTAARARPRKGRQSVIDHMVLLRKKTRSAMGSSANETEFSRIASNARFPPAIALRRELLVYGAQAQEARPRKWSQARNRLRNERCSRSLWNMKITVFIGAFTYALWLKHCSPCNDGMSDWLIHSHPNTSDRSRRKEPRFPRVIQYIPGGLFKPVEWENWQSVQRNVEPMGDPVAQRSIRKDDTITLDKVETEDCKLRFDWQKRLFPTCNLVHEMDATTPWISHGLFRQKHYRVVGNGYWRDVWIINEDFPKERGIFKTMRYKHDYTPRNFDRMRRDALTMERLTESPFIIDIYSFCGTTSMSEFGDGGDIEAALWPPVEENSRITQLEKLRIATQASIGLATMHNIDSEGEASIAHTDISPSQFVKVGEIYKLNDFNRARFLPWSERDQKICPYRVATNPGKFRSPEEYNYEDQTEMVDVYSFGNVLFTLLQEEYPFGSRKTEEAQEMVKRGRRPDIYFDLWNSTDPVNQALKEGMVCSHQQYPDERCSARELAEFFKQKIRELDPGQLEKWGLS